MILKNVVSTGKDLHVQDIIDSAVVLVYNTDTVVLETPGAVKSYLVGDLARMITAGTVTVTQPPSADVPSNIAVGTATVSATTGSIVVTGVPSVWGTNYVVFTSIVSSPVTVARVIVTPVTSSFTIAVKDAAGAAIDTTSVNAVISYGIFKSNI